jgi:hypothetical protein
LPVTASARSLPSLISGTAGAAAPNEIGVWPATAASHRVAAALERHVHEVELEFVLEQRADELRRCERPVRPTPGGSFSFSSLLLH